MTAAKRVPGLQASPLLNNLLKPPTKSIDALEVQFANVKTGLICFTRSRCGMAVRCSFRAHFVHRVVV